jgi:hypothetical protein
MPEGKPRERKTGLLRTYGALAINSLLLVQLVGFVLSALLFGVTFADREQVVARLQGLAVARVEAFALTQLEGLEARLDEAEEDAGALGRLAARLADQAGALDAAREDLVPQLVASVLSQDCGNFCVPGDLLTVIADAVVVEQVAQLRLGEATVRDLIAQRYERTLRGLVADLRRFGAVNMAAFALMMGLVLARRIADWRFVAFSCALLGVTAYMTYWYVFGQNWAQAILFQEWSALFYQGAMIFACCVMIDWLFLRGRITERVLDTISAFSA